jgi:hypothetical protein
VPQGEGLSSSPTTAKKKVDQHIYA